MRLVYPGLDGMRLLDRRVGSAEVWFADVRAT